MLTAWFYDPASDHHGWMNKVIAMLDAPFCHVELQFPDSTAYTVYMGSEVVKKQRSFNNACYSAVQIPCTAAQCATARRVADRLYTARLHCSALDMTSCIFGVEMCPNKTFCSKLVAQILHESQLLATDTDFRTISPSKLHKCLSNKNHVQAQPTQISFPRHHTEQPRSDSCITAAHRVATTPVQAIDFRAAHQLTHTVCKQEQTARAAPSLVACRAQTFLP